jgi:cobalt-zinc-cadmium efflux system protein
VTVHAHTHDGHGSAGYPHGLSSSRALALALALTLAFAAVEAVGGWWTGSLALLGDAGHMLSDAAALGIAALAAVVSRRPPTERHSYGLGRVEAVVALGNAVLMLGVVVALTVAAVDRWLDPQPIRGAGVMVVATLGLLANLVVMRVLSRGEQTLNTRGALLHVLGDLLGSVAAIVSGAVILLTGWTPIDPLLSVLIGALILRSSLALLWEVLRVLMEGVPPHVSLAEVGRALAGVPGVRSVHDLHIWTVSSGNAALSAHLVVDDLLAWPGVLAAAREMLGERYGIHHVTVQPEPLDQVIRPMAWRGRGAGGQGLSRPAPGRGQ